VSIKTALASPHSRAQPAQRSGGPPAARSAARDPVTEFERIYRDNIDVVMGFFARRTTEPQTVADLTADTFVAAITSLGTFDPRKGTARAWVLGIARRVFAAHCESLSRQQDQVSRLAGRRDLEADQIEELEAKIDAQRSSRQLLQALAALPETDRVAVELVDVAGLKPGEAAAALGIAAGTLRMRLMRARARLRKEASGTVAKKSPDNTTEDSHDEVH
jgi:RNA polymerase sigma-70 factor (ECF subfamily)